jgi:aminobenzoyl-glutamate utilization protein B
MNRVIMDQFRDEMSEYYFDSEQYDSYLDQLGVSYPTLRQPDGRCTIGSVSEQGTGAR